jgi:Protein of unknown function (DUF4013)
MTLQSVTAPLKPLFRFPFQDSPSRSRFLLGSALVLASYFVPIVPGLFSYGYALRILRSTAEGKRPGMPPWNDWSDLLSLGFRGAIVQLVFMLPGIVIALFGFAAYFGTFLLIPLSVRPDGGADSPILVLLPVAMAVLFLSMAISTVLFVLGMIPLPAAIAHFAVKDQLGAAFKVREWWGILKSNSLGYLISFVIIAGILGIAYTAFFAAYYTLVLLCLVFFMTGPLAFYTMLLSASLFGETYREGLSSLQERSKASA